MTGVSLNSSILNGISDKKTSPLVAFYYKSLNNRLSSNNFEFKNQTTIQKLQVLSQTLQLSTSMKMIGDFSGNYVNLKTDKITGNVKSFLGFIKSGNYYFPNTVIADDMRNNADKVYRVLAIISKRSTDEKYNKIEAVGKKVDIYILLKKLNDKFSLIDNNLLEKLFSEKETEYEKEKFLEEIDMIKNWSDKAIAKADERLAAEFEKNKNNGAK